MEFVSSWIIEHIETFGYLAIFVLMALESANIPIPSEITLPFAGFLVSRQQLDFHLAAFMGAIGCLFGSMVSYGLGKWLGRTFLERYGAWFGMGSVQIALGDRWMSQYGNFAAFFSRLLPVVRTFISFIAGIWSSPFPSFCLLTFIGSWIWSYLLVYAGVVLGSYWSTLHAYGQSADIGIVGAILVGFIAYLWWHWKEISNVRKKNRPDSQKNQNQSS